MARRVYILAADSISADTRERRLDRTGYVRCEDPDFSSFFSPMQARRMGLLFKRAMATSKTVMKDSGIGCPDAIVTGTGLGCMENTELFFSEIITGEEESLSPTPFIQSTHNTVSSLIAIQTACHSYNCTYSQNDISFESALLDAFMQLQEGGIGSALVGANDELTPSTYDSLRRAGYFTDEYFASEGSAALMLSASPGGLAELSDVRILHRPTALGELIDGYGAEYVMGSDEYFRIFGKCFSASGLACVEAARLIAGGEYSDILVVNDASEDIGLVHLKKQCGD